MVTLAASAYFLTCCRPAKKSTFCFYVEPPKFINLQSYIQHSQIQYEIAVCDLHKKLSDHSLNAPTSCTDDRAWSQDNDQRRRHFLDITNKHIPLCAIGRQEAEKRNYDEIQPAQNKEKSQHAIIQKTVPDKQPNEKAVEQEKTTEKDKHKREVTPVKQILEKQKPKKQEENAKGVTPAPPVNQKQEEPFKSKALEKEEPTSPESEKLLAEGLLPKIEPDHRMEKYVLPPPPPEPKKPLQENSFTDIDLTPTKEVSEKIQTRADTPDSISDDIIEKLDFNLVNLEETFDKFVKKNRDFIQNLVKCLTFEKRKQKELEKSYEILKQENDALRIKNEYLKMVNSKQLELFKNELDKGLTETKTVYKAKIKQIETQLHSEQEELKYYKTYDSKYLEVIESETKQVKRLKEQLKSHKAREKEILKNFTSVLDFLECVKNSVNSSDLGNELSEKASGSTGVRENRSIREVLNSALNCGMESLNVRDLSILHDAIQDLNGRLCHQNELCGRNPMPKMSLTQLSMVYAEKYNCCSDPDCQYRTSQVPNAEKYNCCSDPDCQYRTSQDIGNHSCLSLFPSRQKPESKLITFQ